MKNLDVLCNLMSDLDSASYGVGICLDILKGIKESVRDYPDAYIALLRAISCCLDVESRISDTGVCLENDKAGLEEKEGGRCDI